MMDGFVSGGRGLRGKDGGMEFLIVLESGLHMF